MSYVYVTEQGTKVGISNGKLVISNPTGDSCEAPQELVEGLSLFGNVQITTQCIRTCMEQNIGVTFFSLSGNCIGNITPSGNSRNALRAKKQVLLSEDKNFRLELARTFIRAKIHNQRVVAERYMKSDGSSYRDFHRDFKCLEKEVGQVDSIAKLMGLEGIAARAYFTRLGQTVSEDFAFTKRSRRPPRDPFNTMLSMGYSLLTKEIKGHLENHGLLPYIGFLHEDRNGHAALASDMVEEWRPVIVDSLVLSLVRGHEISSNDFICREDGCFFSNKGLKLFLRKYEQRLRQTSKYLPGIERPLAFREALWHQCASLAKAIEECSADEYSPVFIR